MADDHPVKVLDRRTIIKSAAAGVAAGPLLAAGLAAAPAPPGEPRWGFLIDLRKCIGCKACSIACKTEFDIRLGVFRASVKEYEEGKYPRAKRHFLPWLCNHCDSPICLRDCPVDEVEARFPWPDGREETYRKRATYQRPDGLVLIDQDRCIGCGACVDLCPYGVRYLDPIRDVADKCTLCAHRLDAGIIPSCVNTCQGRARMVGDLNEPGSEISRLIVEEDAEPIHGDWGTDPRCFYIGLEPRSFDEGRDVR